MGTSIAKKNGDSRAPKINGVESSTPVRSGEINQEKDSIVDLHENDTDRSLWAAELALAADVLATAFSFAVVCISDSLQYLAAFSQTPLAASAGTGHKLEFLSACEGLIPQTLIDRIARLTSAGIITKGEAEDIACTFVLDERLRPRPWREPREPQRKEVERAVEVARILTKRVRGIRRPPLSAQSG